MYGSKRKRRLHSVAVLLGPLSFGLTILLLEWFFGFKAAAALGTTVWMALWWILRPVNISVTAFVPIGVNALFDLIPMQHVISQYFSEIIVLLFGADLVCLTWATTGLDKRLAIKTLCCIGTPLRQQIAVWLLVATVLSIFLPNVVVCTILVPVAAAKWEENVQPARSPPTNKKPYESAKSPADVGVWKPNLPDRYLRNPSILFPIANTKKQTLGLKGLLFVCTIHLQNETLDCSATQ